MRGVGKVTGIRDIGLREIIEEFTKLRRYIGFAVSSLDANNYTVHDVYVDRTTDELVITHAGGEKRIA